MPRLHFYAAAIAVTLLMLAGAYLKGGSVEREKWEREIALQKGDAALKLAAAHLRTLETERTLAEMSAHLGKEHYERIAEIEGYDRRYRDLVRSVGLYDREARCGAGGGDQLSTDPAAAAGAVGPAAGCRLSDATFEFLWDLAGDAEHDAVTAGTGIDYADGVRRALNAAP